MHEALLPALALFTFTLYWVDTVDRQNLLIVLVSLRCVWSETLRTLWYQAVFCLAPAKDCFVLIYKAWQGGALIHCFHWC